MASHNEITTQLIEGVSNDVLFAVAVALVVLVLAIAWFSTQLTSGQRNLPEIRTTRRGVNIRRIPGSSSSEYAQMNQSSPIPSPSDHSERPIGSEQVQSQTGTPQEGDQSESTRTLSTPLGGGAENATDALASPLTTNDTTPPHSEPLGPNNPEIVNNPSSSSSQPPPEMLSVKLMSLDGQERIVSEPYDTTVNQLRQKHYQSELQARKLVRFIHSGRSLLDDDRLNRLPRIGNHLVLHVSIGDPRSQTDTDTPLEVASFNAGLFMVPMFAVVLALLWILRYQYGQLFNVTSTLSLAGITAVFLYSLHAVSRGNINRTVNNTARRTTYTIRLNGNGTGGTGTIIN